MNDDRRKQGPANGQGNNHGSILAFLIVTFITLGIMSLVNRAMTSTTTKEITYDQFLDLLDNNLVESVTVDTNKLEIVTKKDQPLASQGIEVTYYTGRMDDDKLVDRLQKAGVEFKEEIPDNTTSLILNVLLSFAPLVLIWVLMGVLLRRMNSSTGMMGVGKSRAKMYMQNETGVTFKDVAGEDEAKESLQEAVDFLEHPERYAEIGAKLPKGALLVGPPGTGKTLLAKAVAGEAKVPFFSLTGSDFVEMFVGVGASRVRDLFETAKKNAPAIIFIDEIDAVGRHRGAGMGGGHDEREQTLNQLLVEMDGFSANLGIVVIAATNRPDILDPALLRPGRFDRQVTVNLPDVKGREAILKIHARNKPLGPDVDLNEIARTTAGFSGADLENLLNEAALAAAKHGQKAITNKDVEEAAIKVVVGPEKRSHKMTLKEKKLTAYHESGHAITNYYLPDLDPVHEISIIPRGQAGGYTMSLPAEDRSYMTKKNMLDQLVTLLGGRVSEAIIMGDISTGASNDIERATKIAKNMVTKYGMTKALGPITYGSDNDEVFLGIDYNRMRDYSEETAGAIDREVAEIMNHAYAQAEQILKSHVNQLHKLARYLGVHEKINGEDFKRIMTDDSFGNVDDPFAETDPQAIPPVGTTPAPAGA